MGNLSKLACGKIGLRGMRGKYCSIGKRQIGSKCKCVEEMIKKSCMFEKNAKKLVYLKRAQNECALLDEGAQEERRSILRRGEKAGV